MAYQFFGVYFQDDEGEEYRCGFHDDTSYMPTLEQRTGNHWVKVATTNGTNSAKDTSIFIRNNLQFVINFSPNAHTQNQRLEVVNQIVYNINRRMTEKVNSGGAHT